MTQEDKELLLSDLCARIPYYVKCNYNNIYNNHNGTLMSINNNRVTIDGICKDIVDVKPYLFPMSSMTEEQKNDFFNCCYNAEQEASKFSNGKLKFVYDYEIVKIDWFNKNHFDYRGLIEKGLAIDATGLNNIY